MEDSLKHFDSKQPKNVEVASTSSSKFIGKVFLYTAIALAITAVTAAILGIVFSRAFTQIDYSTFEIDTVLIRPYLYLLIGAIVMYLPLIIWIHIICFRGRGRMDIPFVLYAIVMGVLVSSMTMFVPISLTAISFGITCVVFGVLSLIGLTAKRDLSFLGLVALGIFFGAILIALFNFIWSFFFPSSFQTIYWLISFAIFVAMMLITIFDVWRVKRLAQAGEQTNNVALYCAFNLYVDFIYIFIRILRLIVTIYARNR